MEIIAILLFPLLVIIAGITILRKNSRGKRLKIIFVIVGLPFLIFFIDEILGQAALHTACAISGGTKINKPVTSDGYFATYDRVSFNGCSLECITALTKRKFKYYEVEVKKGGRTYFTNETGIHKFFLAKKGTSECSAKQSKLGFWGKVPDKMCIAYVILSEPSSRYSVTGGVRDRYRKTAKVGFWPFNLQKNQTVVKDRTNDLVAGSVTTYWYWGGWLRNNSFSFNGASNCSSLPLSHGDVFTKIIRPQSL